MIRLFFWLNLFFCAVQCYYVLYGSAKPFAVLLVVLAAFVAGRLSAVIELERME